MHKKDRKEIEATVHKNKSNKVANYKVNMTRKVGHT